VALPVRLSVLRALTKEISTSAGDTRPIAVAGPLADVLRRELVRGGDESAVRVADDPRGAAVLVYVLGRAVTDTDEEVLKRARRARVPIVAVAEDAGRIPYVLATDIVPLARGAGFPVEAVALAIARKLGEDGTALAARLPVLRPAVCDWLISTFAKRNGVTGAVVFVPGVDLPILTLRQIRLVLRIALAYGEDVDNRRALELLGVVGAGFGFRAVARELLDLVPVAGWALKGAVAYGGTKAVGEAAVRYFEARSSTSLTR
jgi:uncharacterized protein (DUF697 family)